MKKKFFKTAAIAAAGWLSIASVISANIPDSFSQTADSPFSINSSYLSASKSNASNLLIVSNGTKSYQNTEEYDVKLLGVLPIKKVTVKTVEKNYVIPCGIPFGIKMYTSGVVIVGINEVYTASGPINPAKTAGLKIGDVICSINGQSVNTNEEVASIVESNREKQLSFIIRRNNMTFTVTLTPALCSDDNKFKAGLWVRDSSAGIGTMTFLDPDTMFFGGLGHGICDVDTGEILPLSTGDVVPVHINGVVKGSKGKAGELRGQFDQTNAMGKLLSNGETGIYGRLNQKVSAMPKVEVAMKQEVEVGDAMILTTINGNTPQAYKIQIEKIMLNDSGNTKNMIIKVTDPTLLEIAGGIVQGMSGSPIIQNGKLVGAVTHVFVNDKERGYGIFAENMLKEIKNIEKSQNDVENKLAS